MLAAAFFSLILPGLEAAEAQGAGEVGAVTIVISGILLGAAGFWLVHRYTPHEHFVSAPEGTSTAQFRRLWLFLIAIPLHNFPESLADAVGIRDAHLGNGTALANGLDPQNLTEVLAGACPP